jgi:hypothetical protein
MSYKLILTAGCYANTSSCGRPRNPLHIAQFLAPGRVIGCVVLCR